jgi:hypothetical protein
MAKPCCYNLFYYLVCFSFGLFYDIDTLIGLYDADFLVDAFGFISDRDYFPVQFFQKNPIDFSIA